MQHGVGRGFAKASRDIFFESYKLYFSIFAISVIMSRHTGGPGAGGIEQWPPDDT